MKKKKWLFLTVLILAMMLPGCGNTQQKLRIEETEKEEKLQIGLSFDSFVIERWLRDRDMFVSTAQSLGAEVNVQVAGGIVEEQISQIEYFIKKKMDVIVVIPIDGEALYDVLKEAKDKGIYVICYDRVVENIGADLYITIDNEKVGTLMGEALVPVSYTHLIMISSEMPEILGMCDRIYVMNEGKMAGELDAREATQEGIMSHIMQNQNK